jgi:hypothetical protein
MVANKQKPFYRCIESVDMIGEGFSNVKYIKCTFNIGWEYPKDYVEERVNKHLLTKYFKFFE